MLWSVVHNLALKKGDGLDLSVVSVGLRTASRIVEESRKAAKGTSRVYLF